MNKLKSFLASNQIMSYRPPTLGRKEVDLYRLFREVTAYGGCESVVSKEGTWAKIYRGLDNFSPTETSASFRLKKMYTKYLLAYEKHVFNFLPMPAKKHRYPHTGNAAGTAQSGGIQNSAIFPPSSSFTASESMKPHMKPYQNNMYADNTMQSSSLLTSTHYTPGAGIGLIGGGVGWEKEGGVKTRGVSMKRSFETASRSTASESGSRGDYEVGGHRLRGSSTPKESFVAIQTC